MQRKDLGWVWTGLLLAAGPAPADVQLNELLADPAMDWSEDGVVHSRDDEWIEIVNDTGVPVDLTGVRVASADTIWRYEFSGTLAPGETRVAFGSDSYEWERDTGHPAFGFRLTNTGGTVGLWRLTETDTTRIDEVTYGDDAAEDDRSLGRLTSEPSEWVLFDGLNPYSGDAPPFSSGCAPTPGFTNECVTPVIEESWGALKGLYGVTEG